MAFTSSGSLTGAALVEQLYSAQIINAVYSNPFFADKGPEGGSLFRAYVQPGGSAARWVTRSGSNDSVELFDENQAQPDPGNQEYTNCAVSFSYGRAMIQLTGHASDYLQSKRAGAGTVWSMEIEGAALDVGDLMSTTAITNLETAVDSTTSYAGVTRGANAWFESYEDAVNGFLSTADLLRVLQNLRSPSYGASWRTPSDGAILLSPEQWTRLYNLTGGPYVQTTTTSDKLPGYHRMHVAEFPVYSVPDQTSTIALFLGRARDSLVLPIIRPLRLKDMAPSGDSNVAQLSTAAALGVVKDPWRCAKLTALTA